MDTVAKNLLKRDERVELEVDIKHYKFVLCYMYMNCIVECNFVMIFIMSLTGVGGSCLLHARYDSHPLS